MGLIDKAQVISEVDTLIKSYTPKDGISKTTNFMLLKIVCKVLDVIHNVPEVEGEPVRHGRWLNVQNGRGVCSECHRQDAIDPIATHCRYCGAKMGKED